MRTRTPPVRYYAVAGLRVADWTELENLGLEALGFDPDQWDDRVLTRGQWLLIAYLCLGKAAALRQGRFDWPGSGDDCDTLAWARQLRGIARRIHATFPPGDGRR